MSYPPPMGFMPPPPSATGADMYAQGSAYPIPGQAPPAGSGGYYGNSSTYDPPPSAPFNYAAPQGYPNSSDSAPPPAGYPGGVPPNMHGTAPAQPQMPQQQQHDTSNNVQYDERGQPMVYDRGLGTWVLVGAATVAAGYAINHVVKKHKKSKKHGKDKKEKKDKKHKKGKKGEYRDGAGDSDSTYSSTDEDGVTETYINPETYAQESQQQHQQNAYPAPPQQHQQPYGYPRAQQFSAPYSQGPYAYPPQH